MSDPVGSTALDAVVLRDVVYTEQQQGHDLKADIYLARRAGSPTPAMVLYHGGAWTKGTRASYAAWGTWLSSIGITAMAVDYTLARDNVASYPQCILDGQAAVRYLRRHADRLNVSTDAIGVMGGSAGAYLAAMVALTFNGDGAKAVGGEGDPVGKSGVDVAVCLAGTYDLMARWEQDQLDRPARENSAEQFIGGDPTTHRRAYYEGSPVYHASAANVLGTKWLLSWGTEDDVTPPEQSLAFSRHLKRAGALVRHVPVPGAPHFWYFEGDVAEGPFLPFFAGRLKTFLRMWARWSLVGNDPGEAS